MEDFFVGGIFAEDDVVFLSFPSDEENDLYLGVDNEMCEGRNFSVIVKLRRSNEVCGFCLIMDDTAAEWEIGIHLLENYRCQGIGYRALNLFMERYSELRGCDHFISRVDPRNYASQRLMEKLGGVPDGIVSIGLFDEKLNWALEEALLNTIDDTMRATAEKFGVEPRKLLSHVLKYRIDVKKAEFLPRLDKRC